MTVEGVEERRDRELHRLGRDVRLLRSLAEEIELRLQRFSLEDLRDRLATATGGDGG